MSGKMRRAVRVIERRHRCFDNANSVVSCHAIHNLSPCHSWPLRVPNQPLVCEEVGVLNPFSYQSYTYMVPTAVS